MMADKLEEFLRFLAKKGDWHSLGEVAEAVGLSKERAEMIALLFEELP